MARTVVLVRHGRSTANVAAVLAGRSPGVELDDTGRQQAEALVGRFADVTVAAVVSSPLERCRQTVAPLVADRGLQLRTDDGLVEVDYGSWTGRSLSELSGEPLWRTVQQHPSAARFPDGESLAEMSARAVSTVRRLMAEVEGDGVLVVCSHGDVIKALLADALGSHLDSFQRISVAPASISVVRYTEHRPFVDRLGDTGTLAGLGAPPPPAAEPATGAADTGGSSTAPAQTAASAQVSESDAVPGGATGVPPASAG